MTAGVMNLAHMSASLRSFLFNGASCAARGCAYPDLGRSAPNRVIMLHDTKNSGVSPSLSPLPRSRDRVSTKPSRELQRGRHVGDPASVKDLLHEDLKRRLWPI